MRHQIITTSLFLLAGQTCLPPALDAQDPDEIFYTVGATMEDDDSDGQAWSYLLWQTEDLQRLQGREFAVYSKAGAADSLNPFEFEGTARLHLDPAAIAVLLSRGTQLGDDPVRLEGDINSLFEELVPDSSLPLTDKISAVVEGCLADPELFENLVFLSRTHPTLSLVMGTGFASRQAAGQPRTWEVRECPVGSATVDECDEVMARITLEVGLFLPLPAPGPPVYVPFADEAGQPDPRAHLNVPLRWYTPDSLRLRSLLQFGFNLFRMSAADAVTAGFDTQPPPPAVLRDLADNPSHSTTQVNHAPILTDRMLDKTEASNLAADPHTYFFMDDNGRFSAGGVPFQNGEEYFYFVTARDILGRDGEVSEGAFVRICDFLPPPQPKQLVVTNHYSFDTATDTNTQYLKVKWQPPDTSHAQTPESISGYQVYRWWSIGEMQQRDAFPHSSASSTEGGLVAILPASQTEYIDDGPTAPYLSVQRLPDGSTNIVQGSAGETFWYSVRAVDDSACGGNLSGNSAPAYGVLRDRIGPEKSSGTAWIQTLEITVSSPLGVQVHTPFEDPPEFGSVYLTLEGTRDPAGFVDWVEFSVTDPLTKLPVLLAPRAYFTTGASSWQLQAKVPMVPGVDTMEIGCRMGGPAEASSSWHTLTTPILVPTEYPAFFISWDGQSDLIRTSADAGSLPHITVNPDGSINPVELEFQLTEGTEEWKVYRRVEQGQLSLVKQGLDSHIDTLWVIIEDYQVSAIDARICYFVQLFDQHGNPSPIERVICVETLARENLPVPMLARPLATGDETTPAALLSWFCPPYGIEQFDLLVSTAGGNPPDTLGDDFEAPGTDEIRHGQEWRVFRSKRLPTTWPGNTPEFTTPIDGIQLGVLTSFRIQAVGISGSTGEPSNEVRFLWNPETAPGGGPDVPWPARGLPAVTGTFTEQTLDYADYDQDYQGGAILLATLDYGAIDNPVDPADPSDFYFPELVTDPNQLLRTGSGESILPFVLYRYQMPNENWPVVSGDVYQVSPMIESIAARIETFPYTPPFDTWRNYDPFFFLVGDEASGSTLYYLMLKDTQPVTSGARYRYLVVRFDPVSKEVAAIIPVDAIDIP